MPCCVVLMVKRIMLRRKIRKIRKNLRRFYFVAFIETKVDVSGEGSILATPSIHSAPEKLKEAQVDGE